MLERAVLTPSDFKGSPFRLLLRIGNKIYRPSRAVPDTGVLPPPAAKVDSHRNEPGVWDWG
ncbi:hypothetical protein [Niveispirillum lacus]|nr:hypothetical protein [Niveispirillum lacus]